MTWQPWIKEFHSQVPATMRSRAYELKGCLHLIVIPSSEPSLEMILDPGHLDFLPNQIAAQIASVMESMFRIHHLDERPFHTEWGGVFRYPPKPPRSVMIKPKV